MATNQSPSGRPVRLQHSGPARSHAGPVGDVRDPGDRPRGSGFRAVDEAPDAVHGRVPSCRRLEQSPGVSGRRLRRRVASPGGQLCTIREWIPQPPQKHSRHSLHDRTKDIISISASPIPDSNVIRIEATATARKVAITASNAIAKSLVEQVNAVSKPTPQKLLAEHHSLTVAIIEQEAKIRRLPKSATAAAVAQEQATTGHAFDFVRRLSALPISRRSLSQRSRTTFARSSQRL